MTTALPSAPSTTNTSGSVSVVRRGNTVTIAWQSGVIEMPVAHATDLFQALGPVVAGCRECGAVAVHGACPDPSGHDRQYRGSETTWLRAAA